MSGPHWWPAYVGVGSNLDSPEKQVKQAMTELQSLPNTDALSESALYRSGPLGSQDQPDYINAVAGLLTTLSARELLDELHKIENKQGRVRDGSRWGPRTLDLDLLAYAGQSTSDESLTVPHPHVAERNFVLFPWKDIAPHFQIPGKGTVSCLASKVSAVEPHIECIA